MFSARETIFWQGCCPSTNDNIIPQTVLQVFYRTTMPVPANRELMVYYGPSYASDLGIDPDKQLTVYQIYKNPGEYNFAVF